MGTRDITLANLRLAIRRITDTENDPHKTDAWLTDIINEARAEVYDILRRADPDQYEASQTITIGTPPGSTDTYALPSDYYDTKSVDWRVTTGSSQYWEPLTKVDLRTTLEFQQPTGYAYVYRIVGSNLVLYPPPTAGQIYRHIYTPAAVVLSADADVVDGREATLIKYRCAVVVALREENDPRPFETEYQREVERLTAQTDNRVPRRPNTIEEVEDYSDRAIWIRSLPLPRPPRP